MATVSGLSAIVKQIIDEYASYQPSYGEIEVETVVDEARGHYELVYAGWLDQKRVHGSVVHLDVKGDKVWVQHDGTEHGVANDLLRLGVPHDRIVLAFQHPTLRRHGEFAFE